MSDSSFSISPTAGATYYVGGTDQTEGKSPEQTAPEPGSESKKKFSARPSAGMTYYMGGPDLRGGRWPNQAAASLGLDIEAGPEKAKLKLSGEVVGNYYQDFRQLQLLNPQFKPLITHDGSDIILTQFKLPEANLSFSGKKAGVSLGYQQVTFAQTAFPLAPANVFFGTDYSAANQIPTYRPPLSLQGKKLFGKGLASKVFFVVAPSSETRNIMPFQIERLKTSLPVDSLQFVNQGRALDVDGLLGYRGDWDGTNLLLTISREHDHFFKIGSGELDPVNSAAVLRGIYPARETAATELAGNSGDLYLWLQGNFSYYERAQNGHLSSPLGDSALDYSRYSYQGALGLKYIFSDQDAYIAAQGFYGSLTGNGELNQAVASAGSGIQFFNDDLKLGALVNAYFETRQPKLESFINMTYQPVPGVEVSIGGRLAQTGIFSLAQPWYGYISLRYKK